LAEELAPRTDTVDLDRVRRGQPRVVVGRLDDLVLEEEGESSAAPMPTPAPLLTLLSMKRSLLFILIASGLIVLALAGWTAQGLRWALWGGPRPVGTPVPA